MPRGRNYRAGGVRPGSSREFAAVPRPGFGHQRFFIGDIPAATFHPREFRVDRQVKGHKVGRQLGRPGENTLERIELGRVGYVGAPTPDRLDKLRDRVEDQRQRVILLTFLTY